MSLTAADIMQADAKSVAPDAPLLDVERAFIEEQVGGFPVLDDGRLVGVVSRSDIVRQLCVEQSLSEEASDYFRQFHEYIDNAEETLTVIAERVGRRIEHLSVDDVMRRNLVTVPLDASLVEVARHMTERQVHRVLVLDGDRLCGVITTLDFARLVVDARLIEAE